MNRKASQAESRPLISVPESIIGTSEALLTRPRWRRRHESILYWAGIEEPNRWVVTTVIAPEATTTWGSYRVSSISNAAVISQISGFSLTLLAQVHTHPGDFIGHSDGDDCGAMMPYENFLSIIVPAYCRDGILPFSRCGIHRFEHTAFRQLEHAEIEKLFQVIPVALDLRRK